MQNLFTALILSLATLGTALAREPGAEIRMLVSSWSSPSPRGYVEPIRELVTLRLNSRGRLSASHKNWDGLNIFSFAHDPRGDYDQSCYVGSREAFRRLAEVLVETSYVGDPNYEVTGWRLRQTAAGTMVVDLTFIEHDPTDPDDELHAYEEERSVKFSRCRN